MKSSMIEIKIGEKVVEAVGNGKGKKGILKDIKLVPNGCNPRSRELVVLLYVYIEKEDKIVTSTSENWMPDEDETYSEFYPSVHLNHLCNEIWQQVK